MSTLTKVFVVILFVASLFCSIVVVQTVATQANWKALADTRKQQAEAARTSADSYHQEYQVAKTKLTAAHDRESNLQKQLAAKDAAVLAAERALYKAQEQVKTLALLQANFDALEAQLGRESDMNEAKTKELKAARSQIIAIQNEKREIERLRKEKTAAAELLEKQLEVVKERQVELAAENDRLRAELEAAGGKKPTTATPPVVVIGPKIEGSVTSVKGDLAVLNVGEASGVQRGVKFTIYRGSDYVATLKVSDVYRSQCAGIIESAKRDVLKGDKATTKLE